MNINRKNTYYQVKLFFVRTFLFNIYKCNNLSFIVWFWRHLRTNYSFFLLCFLFVDFFSSKFQFNFGKSLCWSSSYTIVIIVFYFIFSYSFSCDKFWWLLQNISIAATVTVSENKWKNEWLDGRINEWNSIQRNTVVPNRFFLV